MKKTWMLSIAAATALMSMTASASVIELTGTIRDFTSSHSDFQRAIDGHVTGMVETTLGADGNPVYSGKCTASVYNCGENFNDWYNTIDGVNMALSHTITLDNTLTADPNVYSYVNNSFFPIDGQGFGNEGMAHNYYFTYEIGTTFTYNGGEMFSFTGDDDLWVFINDQLVVDIGGVHGAITRSVNLDTLGLTIGNEYSFDLFFAERYCCGSNFRIDTSIALNPTGDVPEPSALALLGAGLLGFTFMRRRQSQVSLEV